MATTRFISTGLLRASLFAALLAITSIAALRTIDAAQPATRLAAVIGTPAVLPAAPARKITISYTAHDGRQRNAYVLLPHGYRPGNNPAIPLIISPHGRAVDGLLNTRRFGNLPTLGNFAVVNPDGEGRRLPLHSWGAPGQIDDLARMPAIVTRALPWIRIDRRRLYAMGASMGGQETLLLLGRYPHLLAGAAAVDGVVDFPRQYRNYPQLGCNALCHARFGDFGRAMQVLAQRELGGTPETAPAAYAARSPISYASAIAASCVPLQVWWSSTDRTVMEADKQSGLIVRELERLGTAAAVDEYVGTWAHTHVMDARLHMETMLSGFGLLPASFDSLPTRIAHRQIRPTNGCVSR